MITKNIPFSKIIVISKAIKWGICFEFNGKSMETETTQSEFPYGRKAIVEKILALKVINRGKRSKTISEAKPVENISKNPQSVPEISPMQKEVLLSHKPQDHAYK